MAPGIWSGLGRTNGAGTTSTQEKPTTKAQAVVSPQDSANALVPIPSLDPADFTIALICPLPLEYDAILNVLDSPFEELPYTDGKVPTLVGARMAGHTVVVAMPKRPGKINTTIAAERLSARFPNLKLTLLVGICSGIPTTENDVRLGDVVISKWVGRYALNARWGPTDLVPRDFPEPRTNSQMMLLHLYRLLESEEIRKHSSEYMARMIADSERRVYGYPEALHRMLESEDIDEHFSTSSATNLEDLQLRDSTYKYPEAPDVLLPLSRIHIHRSTSPSGSCQDQSCGCDSQSQFQCDEAKKATCGALGCDEDSAATREPRDFKIHAGGFGSEDITIEGNTLRDELGKRGYLALDMDAAGIMHQGRALAIKGVANYADTHENKEWRHYAAATAACTAKALIAEFYPREHVEEVIAIPTSHPISIFSNLISRNLKLPRIVPSIVRTLSVLRTSMPYFAHTIKDNGLLQPFSKWFRRLIVRIMPLRELKNETEKVDG